MTCLSFWLTNSQFPLTITDFQVERENQRLANKIVKLTDNSASESQKLMDLEDVNSRLEKDSQGNVFWLANQSGFLSAYSRSESDSRL